MRNFILPVAFTLLAMQLQWAVADGNGSDLCHRQAQLFETSLRSETALSMTSHQIRKILDLSRQSCNESMAESPRALADHNSNPEQPADQTAVQNKPASSDPFTNFWLLGTNPNKDGNKRIKRMK